MQRLYALASGADTTGRAALMNRDLVPQDHQHGCNPPKQVPHRPGRRIGPTVMLLTHKPTHEAGHADHPLHPISSPGGPSVEVNQRSSAQGATLRWFVLRDLSELHGPPGAVVKLPLGSRQLG